MKIYISCDIEGTAGISHWNEATSKNPEYKQMQIQMTREVLAACEGALEAGATEIYINDAHDTGRNLILSELPKEAKIIRGWSWHPYTMLQELDNSFDAVMFTGFHSKAGSNTNPLAHSQSTIFSFIKINDVLASEFIIHSYTASMLGVPQVFLSGDKGVCDDARMFNKNCVTVETNIGVGDSNICNSPRGVLEQIKLGVQKSLKRDFASSMISLPKSFNVKIRYKKHQNAYKNSFYPGMEQIDEKTLMFNTTDYFEVIRALLFVSI